MCDWKVTPASVILRSFDRLMTWKPPESVMIGPFQRMKRCRPPSLATRSAPGPQHQVVGVGEDDVGAGRLELVGVESLHGGSCPHRHEGRRADWPMRRRDLAQARAAVGLQEREGEAVRHGCAGAG